MAPNDSAQTTEEAEDLAAGRGRAARYFVPVAVAGVAAATIGLVPALAASGDPDLPKITAQELIEKMAASDTQQLSGTVKINTDLGLPLGGLAGLGGGSFSPKGQGGGSSAAPESKLMELASGSHTLRVAADGPDKAKVSILEDAAEYSLIHNGGEVWAYDSASNEAFHAKDDGSGHKGKKHEALPKDLPTTPKQFADEALKAADDTTSVTVGGTARVAGRDAYQLVIKPKQSGSTIGSIKIAVDAEKGVPLKFTLTPTSGGKAVVDAGFTKVDFSKPAASTFDFTPPKGAKVTEADELEKGKGAGNHEEFKGPKDFKGPKEFKGHEGVEGAEDFKGLNVIGEGWTSIAKIETPGGKASGAPKDGDVPPEASKLLDALGDKVEGKFGSGTVFKTRLVNALMTDDGTFYVGAVTKDALVKAANEGK
ncbi:outer membrane lipoprotein-sorting protein [Streptomyces sp. SLBN-118]|uniref:LolA family protein n=1 Tax=Streptomyces sp. SLBN-118 TaxID=2768454 RepID=UPI001152B446|nr:outer membrane lipoprotein carrier protein LolA [Streptomyces sp. SLBN-118]TQK52553.1 outer membrane lipoprotein-sorting protein [Streptomyces sp. SLBN-118]